MVRLVVSSSYKTKKAKPPLWRFGWLATTPLAGWLFAGLPEYMFRLLGHLESTTPSLSDRVYSCPRVAYQKRIDDLCIQDSQYILLKSRIVIELKGRLSSVFVTIFSHSDAYPWTISLIGKSLSTR